MTTDKDMIMRSLSEREMVIGRATDEKVDLAERFQNLIEREKALVPILLPDPNIVGSRVFAKSKDKLKKVTETFQRSSGTVLLPTSTTIEIGAPVTADQFTSITDSQDYDIASAWKNIPIPKIPMVPKESFWSKLRKRFARKKDPLTEQINALEEQFKEWENNPRCKS
jgi:hypothetical protein